MPITIKDGTPLEGETLCLTCVYGFIQRGYRESEEDVFCCYVQFRPVRFKVRECTAFCSRTLPTRYEMEKIALVIPTTPARKPAGFSGLGTFPKEDMSTEGEAEFVGTVESPEDL
jgi:hypothetical protein